MDACKKYDALHPDWKKQIEAIIKKMAGKSNIADISIDESDLSNYEFKISVLKFNSRKGWATVGYVRNDLFHGGVWRLTYKPKLLKGEKPNITTGRTPSFN